MNKKILKLNAAAEVTCLILDYGNNMISNLIFLVPQSLSTLGLSGAVAVRKLTTVDHVVLQLLNWFIVGLWKSLELQARRIPEWF